MDKEQNSNDNKNYLFVGIFLLGLIAVGAYFVYKIPSPVDPNQLSQNLEYSDNMDTVSKGETLGAETSGDVNTADSNKKAMQNDQLVKEDLVVGTGVEATAGKTITVNYLGTLTNGTKFDSSYDRNQPFTFNLGAGEVIQGWDQGFSGMKVGGKRKLTIPPSMGYGSQDLGTIPPNSTLIFEVELLKVE